MTQGTPPSSQTEHQVPQALTALEVCIREAHLSLEFFSRLNIAIVSGPQSGKSHHSNLACVPHIMREEAGKGMDCDEEEEG